MKKLGISLFFAFVFCSALTMLGFSGECGKVRDEVFRLHVLANSDSERDQTLKLKVRDGILELSEILFKNAVTKDEAIEAARKNAELIKERAEEILRRNGCNDSVKIEIGESSFDTRQYGNITLPAGEYPALRVLIGKAQGHNWWCVMFPQLCLPAARTEPEEFFTEDEMELISGGEKYELRFKCVEYYEKLKHLFRHGESMERLEKKAG